MVLKMFSSVNQIDDLQSSNKKKSHGPFFPKPHTFTEPKLRNGTFLKIKEIQVKKICVKVI
jgi:hypothetical protein